MESKPAMSFCAGPSRPFFLFWQVISPASSTIERPQTSVAILKDDPGFRTSWLSCDIARSQLSGWWCGKG